MLARRLAARGVALSGGAAVLSQNMASAAVPASVVSSTIKAASLCAAGQAATQVKVAVLAEGVLKAMLMSKLKAAVAVVLVLGFLAIGAIGVGIARGQTKGDGRHDGAGPAIASTRPGRPIPDTDRRPAAPPTTGPGTCW